MVWVTSEQKTSIFNLKVLCHFWILVQTNSVKQTVLKTGRNTNLSLFTIFRNIYKYNGAWNKNRFPK